MCVYVRSWGTSVHNERGYGARRGMEIWFIDWRITSLHFFPIAHSSFLYTSCLLFFPAFFEVMCHFPWSYLVLLNVDFRWHKHAFMSVCPLPMFSLYFFSHIKTEISNLRRISHIEYINNNSYRSMLWGTFLQFFSKSCPTIVLIRKFISYHVKSMRLDLTLNISSQKQFMEVSCFSVCLFLY